MKSGNKGGKSIEKITIATIEAFELLKELQTDLKQKTQRVNNMKAESLKTRKNATKTQKKYEEAELKLTAEIGELQLKIKENAATAKKKYEAVELKLNVEISELQLEIKESAATRQKKYEEAELKLIVEIEELQLKIKDNAAAQKKYEESEMKFNMENKELQLKIKELEQRNGLLEKNAETFAAQLAFEQNKLCTMDQLEKKCLQLEVKINEKEELIVKQQLEIDLKNVECLKFKKMSKKYNKALNTVSPQTVNNVQFVKKFPILESRCISLLEKLEYMEKERDALLLKLGPVRTNSSYKDQLARRDALMINQLSSSNQARSQSSQFVARSASYIPPTHHSLSAHNYQSQKMPSTLAHGLLSSQQGPVSTSPSIQNQTPVTHGSGSLPLGSGTYTRSAIPIARISASISHGAGILAKPAMDTPSVVTPTDNLIPLSNTPPPLSNTPAIIADTTAPVLNTSIILAKDTPLQRPAPNNYDNCSSLSITNASPRKRSLLNHSVRSPIEPRLLGPDKIILRDRIGLAERKKQKIES